MTNDKAPAYRPLPVGRTELQLGGALHYDPHFLSPDAADALLGEVQRSAVLGQETITLFGKPVLQPRRTGWFGRRYTAASGYRDVLPAPPFGPHLIAALQAIASHTDWWPNAVLINHYPNGRSSVGWHADDEPNLGPEPVIASVSLGADRDFLIRPKQATRSDERYRMRLGHGALLLMLAGQQQYQHCVPRRSQAGERYNLTARRYLP